MDNISILIVEDEAIVAKDLASKICRMGYSVAGITATGEEAIELACQKRPALVLMDIRLAGAMDGIVAAQQIHRACNLPTLFLSANSDMATVKRTRLEGAFGYILKPFDDRDLEIQIEMALYKHTTQQRLRESEEALQKSEKQLLVMNNELELRVEQRTQELQEMQKQYLHAEKLAAIGKLSASIAHEVNNPLQSILTILKGLSGKAILEEMDLKLIKIAIGEGDRIKGLIRSLQDFYRPSSRRKTLLDVNSTLDLLLLLQKSDFKNKRILLELDYAERLPMISAVADQIKQVFLNLLTNAKEACLKGGTITISTRQQGEKVAVAIQDTGVGIKPEQMDQIFRPFYSTKPEVKGTGLGLSVSYGIVQKHGGEILVTSKPGEGATFIVLLPINEETAFVEDSVM